jgi:Holliday junction resolvasome RuvABC endonuclease subunit
VIIIGIDPGLSGAVAYLNHCYAHVEDMPVAGGQVDAANLSQMIGLWKSDNEMVAYVEQVGARPGQGVSSMFKFGMSYGAALAVLAACGVPVHLVTPGKWKKALGLSSDKEQSRRRAIELFPKLADDLKRKKDDGRAEALLLAHYGAMEQRRVKP